MDKFYKQKTCRIRQQVFFFLEVAENRRKRRHRGITNKNTMSEKKTLERKETSAKNIIDLLGIPDSSSDEEANNVKAEEADQKDPQKSLASIIPVRYDEFLSNEDAKTTFKTVLKFYKKNMSADCNWYFDKTPDDLFETVGKMQLKGAPMQHRVQSAFDQSCKFQRVGRQALAVAISHCETPIFGKQMDQLLYRVICKFSESRSVRIVLHLTLCCFRRHEYDRIFHTGAFRRTF